MLYFITKLLIKLVNKVKKKGKVIPVTRHGGPCVCETSRLTYDDKVVSLTSRPPFTHRKIPGTHFCYRLSRPLGHSAAGRIRPIEKRSVLVTARIRTAIVCKIEAWRCEVSWRWVFKLWFYGIWCSVIISVANDVSEQAAASVFRV
jgi:hypothetical protein